MDFIALIGDQLRPNLLDWKGRRACQGAPGCVSPTPGG